MMIKGKRLRIDSCCRRDVKYPFPVAISYVHNPKLHSVDSSTYDEPSGQWKMVTKEGVSIVSPHFTPHPIEDASLQTRIGVKALVLSSRGEEMLFKDKAKPWDWIGGNVEIGETPEEALIREIDEETRIKFKKSNLYYWGHSDEMSGERVVYRSHLYVTRWEYFSSNATAHWSSVKELNPSEIQSWCARYQLRLEKCGGSYSLLNFLDSAESPRRKSSLYVSESLYAFLAVINSKKPHDPKGDIVAMKENGVSITPATLDIMAPSLAYDPRHLRPLARTCGVTLGNILDYSKCVHCTKRMLGGPSANENFPLHRYCLDAYEKEEKRVRERPWRKKKN